MNSDQQNIQPRPVAEAGASGVNIKEILLRYLHYWWLFLLLIALALTGAWLFLRYSTPLYSVKASLLIRSDQARGGGGGEDAFADIALFPSSVNKQNEIEILRSRGMMERVVRSLGLQEDYYVTGNVKQTNIYKEAPFDLAILSLADSASPKSFTLEITGDQTFRLNKDPRERYFGERIELREGVVAFIKKISPYTYLNFKEFTVNWYPLLDAAEKYQSGLTVAPANDQSNVLSLTYTTEKPVLGSDILNQLMVEYNEAAIEDKNEINRRIIGFIDDRLGLVENQLDSVETDFQNFRTRREFIDIESQTASQFRSMSDLEQRIREQEIQMQITELLESYLRNPDNKLNLVPSTLGLTDPTLIGLMSGYNSLVAERERQLQTGATATNPVVQNIEKQIEDSRLRMLRNLVNIREVYRSAIDAFSSHQRGIRTDISAVPRKEREAQGIVRQQEIKQNLYLYLLQKKEESAIAEASTIANSRILDNSRPKHNLVSPISLRIYGIALIIGLLVPIIIIYIADLLNDKITTRADLTRLTGAPIVGEIGHSEEEKVLLFPERGRTVIAEQLRILRSNLNFLLGDISGKKPALMVTSSFSGEGKSFVSTNLGAAFAVTGKKVVILEFDLRKPKIIAGLGLAKGQGLTNYLVGGARLEELPQAVPGLDSLYVIPCGPVPPNPSEILLSPRMNDLFAWLKNEFDVVVIDTAPVGLVSDSMTLSKFADATLYIVRQRYTFKSQISLIDDLYTNNKLPRMGLIVNDVKAEGSRGYYGYGGGRYGYGYGYGLAQQGGYYENSAKRKGLRGWFKKFGA